MGRTGRWVVLVALAACGGTESSAGGAEADSTVPTARGECSWGIRTANGGVGGEYSFERFGDRVETECDINDGKPVKSKSWRCEVEGVVIDRVGTGLRSMAPWDDHPQGVTCEEVYVIDSRGVETMARLDAVLR